MTSVPIATVAGGETTPADAEILTFTEINKDAIYKTKEEAYQILADSIVEQVQLAQSENATIVTKSIHLCGEMASDLAFVSALREKMPDCQLTPMDSFSNLRLPTEADDAVFTRPVVPFWTAIGALLILVAGGLLAGWIPAQRAVAIKPIDALREE